MSVRSAAGAHGSRAIGLVEKLDHVHPDKRRDCRHRTHDEIVPVWARELKELAHRRDAQDRGEQDERAANHHIAAFGMNQASVNVRVIDRLVIINARLVVISVVNVNVRASRSVTPSCRAPGGPRYCP